MQQVDQAQPWHNDSLQGGHVQRQRSHHTDDVDDDDDETSATPSPRCNASPLMTAAPTTTTAMTTNGTNHLPEGPRRISNVDTPSSASVSMSREVSSSILHQTTSKQGKLSPFLETSPQRISSLELKGRAILYVLVYPEIDCMWIILPRYLNFLAKC